MYKPSYNKCHRLKLSLICILYVIGSTFLWSVEIIAVTDRGIVFNCLQIIFFSQFECRIPIYILTYSFYQWKFENSQTTFINFIRVSWWHFIHLLCNLLKTYHIMKFEKVKQIFFFFLFAKIITETLMDLSSSHYK